VTRLALDQNNISIGDIYPGTDTTKSIILEAYEDGSPCLLKITDIKSIDHEMSVWEAIEQIAPRDRKNHLAPLKRLDFKKAAIVNVGNLASGFSSLTEEQYSGILMEKYQSTLSRCSIPLKPEVLLHFGKQPRVAISTLHDCGFCHMDIKPANVFISTGATCFLGDYGGATKVGELVREQALSYYPTDAGPCAEQETGFLLLTVTLLELYGSIPSPPSPMSIEHIRANVVSLENDHVKTFLKELLAIA
jgi:serine/threonine protein kinase